MKKIFILTSLIFSLFAFNFTYAVSSLPKAPTLVSSSPTTLDLTWDKLPDAMGYYVYFSKISGKDYKSFGDVFSENKATITNLQPNTTYYIVVTAFDNKNNESFNSPEGVFNTKSGFGEKFGLTEIKAVNFNELELIFNAPLDSESGAIREFKISQSNKEIALVNETKLNEKEDNKLNLILNKNLDSGEYKLTILYITDKSGRNIEEGIDGETKFVIPASFDKPDNIGGEINGSFKNSSLVNNLVDNVTNDNVSSSNMNGSDENVELNSASEVNNNQEQVELNSGDVIVNDYGLAGKDMTGVLSTSEVVSKDNKRLPNTGPESLFIIFLSVMLASMIFYFRKNKA